MVTQPENLQSPPTNPQKPPKPQISKEDNFIFKSIGIGLIKFFLTFLPVLIMALLALDGGDFRRFYFSLAIGSFANLLFYATEYDTKDSSKMKIGIQLELAIGAVFVIVVAIMSIVFYIFAPQVSAQKELFDSKGNLSGLYDSVGNKIQSLHDADGNIIDGLFDDKDKPISGVIEYPLKDEDKNLGLIVLAVFLITPLIMIIDAIRVQIYDTKYPKHGPPPPDPNSYAGTPNQSMISAQLNLGNS